MHLDILLGNAFLNQEHRNLLTLIALKLDDLAKFLVIDKGAIASKLLFERLEKLLRVVFFGEALKSRQSLATIALLDTNVDVAVHLRRLLRFLSEFFGGKLVTNVRKRVVTGQVLNAHTLADANVLLFFFGRKRKRKVARS